MMPHIVVDDRQAKIISEAAQTVEIRDQHGNRLGYVAHPFTDEDFAVAKRRLQSDARSQGQRMATRGCAA
jgi:hypothetical protein